MREYKVKVDSHPIFDLIRSEHQEIRRYVDLLKQSEGDRVQLLQKLQELAEFHHHAREEQLLFAPLLKKERLREGGPFCTFYFDQHVVRPPKSRIILLLGREPGWSQEQIQFKSQPSPLDIPIEEHRCLSALLSRLIEIQRNGRESQFDLIFREYSGLLLLHMEKEEACLFRVCSSLLTIAELDEALSRWSSVVSSSGGGSNDESAPSGEHC